jgi:hypothetical protein
VRECEDLLIQLDETRVEAKFWRSCAERALRLWDRAQDEIELQQELTLRYGRPIIDEVPDDLP